MLNWNYASASMAIRFAFATPSNGASSLRASDDVSETLGRKPVGVVAVGTLAEAVVSHPGRVLHMPLLSAQVNDNPETG